MIKKLFHEIAHLMDYEDTKDYLVQRITTQVSFLKENRKYSAFDSISMGKVGDLCEIEGEISFEWKIKDFPQLFGEIDARYESSKFHFSGVCWELWIYPNGETKYKTDGWIGLYLVRMSAGSPVTVNRVCSVKTRDGNIDVNLTDTTLFDEKYGRWGWNNFISKSELMKRKYEIMPSDTLTIICTLKICETNDVDESYFSRLQDVSDNLKEIYQKGKMTDFTLKVGGESMRTHRMILETRSPVFAAMLNHDTRENQTGEVSIKDLDKSAVDSLLGYLYSGDIDNLTTENALLIYAAADKYDIRNVKTVCVQFILHNLSAKCVCDVIKFADLYNEEEVGRRAREYFTENADAILDSDKWKSFIRENPLMGVELLSSIVKYSLPKPTKQK